MKKYVFALCFACALFLTGCDDDTDPGGTSVQDMAGDWWVTYQNSVDEYNYLIEGVGSMPDVNNIESWAWDYVYSDGHYRLNTYNTAKDIPTEMFVDDASYWGYKVITNVNYEAKTFECPATTSTAVDTIEVTILGGKIMKDAATTPRGMPADSIVFYVQFSDDAYGFTYQKVSGFRRTGFPDDDF